MEKEMIDMTAETFVLSTQWSQCFDEDVKAAAEFCINNWRVLPRSTEISSYCSF